MRFGRERAIDMQHGDCSALIGEIREFLERSDAKLEATAHPDLYSVDALIPIPCPPTRVHRATADTYDIPIHLNSTEIGRLCLMSQLSKRGASYAEITEHQKVACLALLESHAFSSRSSYLPKLDADCVVIESTHLDDFLASAASSALWGGFVLSRNAILAHDEAHDFTAGFLIAENLPKPRTQRHARALERSTGSQLDTDRFLHLYHYLELDYDYEIVSRIKSLDLENTFGLERVLSTGRSELDRLHLVLDGYSDLAAVESLTFQLRDHAKVAESVFYDYGKESNPLPDREHFQKLILEPPSISFTELFAVKAKEKLGGNLKDRAAYEKLLMRLACYWVYRIRCCIAHNKIGEYHFHSSDDLRFVRDFGLPMVQTFVRHRMSQVF